MFLACITLNVASSRRKKTSNKPIEKITSRTKNVNCEKVINYPGGSLVACRIAVVKINRVSPKLQHRSNVRTGA